MYATMGMFKPGIGGEEPPPEEDVYPTLAQRTHSSSTGGTIARSITLPSSISAGQLIVIVIGLETGSITTPPSGYTALLSGLGSVYYKTASGSEGSTVVSWNISSSGSPSNHYALLFDDATQIQVTLDTSPGADPDPPPITVAWGVDKNLFLTVVLDVEGDFGSITYPANCPLYNFSDTTGLNGYLAGATNDASVTFTPNSYDTPVSSNHHAFTLGLAA